MLCAPLPGLCLWDRGPLQPSACRPPRELVARSHFPPQSGPVSGVQSVEAWGVGCRVARPVLSGGRGGFHSTWRVSWFATSSPQIGVLWGDLGCGAQAGLALTPAGGVPVAGRAEGGARHLSCLLLPGTVPRNSVPKTVAILVPLGGQRFRWSLEDGSFLAQESGVSAGRLSTGGGCI